MPLSPNDPDYHDIMKAHRESSLELRYLKNQTLEAKRLRERIKYHKDKLAQKSE